MFPSQVKSRITRLPCKSGKHPGVCLSKEDDNASWDMVTAKYLWEEKQFDEDNDSDYFFVSQEDSMACFRSAYLLSLEQTKLFAKKRKSRLRKAWEGSQVIYNVAFWGATAVGNYYNPAILRTASAAFWSSCRVVAKLF